MLCFLSCRLYHQIAFLDLFIEEGDDLDTRLSQQQTEDQCRNDEDQQHTEVMPIAAPIQARDSLAKGVDPVFERQKRRDRLERRGKNLDRERTAGAGYLQDQYDDRERFADYAEGDRQRIDDQRIDDAGYHAGGNKQQRILALDLEEIQVAQRDDQPLNQADHEEHHISAEEKLYGIRLSELFAVVFG